MAGNPYHAHKNVASMPGQNDRALVVNVMDPLKSGRVQIRIVGKMDDEQAIPDDKLPWVKVRNSTSTASLQTSTATHGLLPGSMVTVEASGQGGQDFLITGTIPNDRKDDQQTIHPATQGKDATDNIFSDDHRQNTTFGWPEPLGKIFKNTTTQGARKLRDSAGRKKERGEEPVDKARNKSKIPKHYGGRSTSKDPKGGTVGTFKFSGKDAQEFIQKSIQNKSAIVPNALSALQNLKKVTGNPSSINSIGASNFSAITSQLSKWFKSNGSKEEQQKYDCEYLIKQLDETLTEDLLLAKQLCLLTEQLMQEEENNGR